MKFGTYLKSCRGKCSLTQEQLVQELYNFDAVFKSLEARSLSRWENGTNLPPSNKQVQIVHFFRIKYQLSFPYFTSENKEHIEQDLCMTAIENIIGKHKHTLLDFPSDMFHANEIKLSQLRSIENSEHFLAILISLLKSLTHDKFKLEIKDFVRWSHHPSNNFWVCEYEKSYGGALFTFRLKPLIFEKLLNFDIEFKDLKMEDFASYDEVGCSYIFLWHAYNKKVAALMFLRYYAHIIANQDKIEEVGTLNLFDEGRKMAKRLNLNPYKTQISEIGTLTSQRAFINDVLINENVLKMFFSKQSCPEDMP